MSTEMSTERPVSIDRPEESSQPPASARQMPDDKRDSQSAGNQGRDEDAKRPEAIVVVRGEVARDQDARSGSKESQPKDKDKSPRKPVSEAKVKMQGRLPALEDDAHVGVEKEQIVVRDGKADLAFTGTLLASAAPSSAPKGQWHEYRVYETNGGKHVFSKVSRTVYAEDQDTHEAEIFDPSPASMPAQLLRSARDLAHSRPLTWMDAAVAFFGYDPLAKDLYRKLSGQFEEHIS
jgi:hypothetical protein